MEGDRLKTDKLFGVQNHVPPTNYIRRETMARLHMKYLYYTIDGIMHRMHLVCKCAKGFALAQI